MTKTGRKNTAAMLPAVPVAEKRNHFGNLEEQICDLLRAADLSASLLEHTLSSGNLGNSPHIYLPEQFQERLIFAADEVQRRASALKDFIYAD